jgi:hypothetical protein
MSNTSEIRKRIRAEALSELRRSLAEMRPPAGKPPAWLTEYARGLAAVSKLLENQIAQAEGRIVRRRRSGGERAR